MGGRGSGWFGDSEGHARAGEAGGRRRSSAVKDIKAKDLDIQSGMRDTSDLR